MLKFLNSDVVFNTTFHLKVMKMKSLAKNVKFATLCFKPPSNSGVRASVVSAMQSSYTGSYFFTLLQDFMQIFLLVFAIIAPCREKCKVWPI